jgi:hypothetical protein
VGSVVVCLHKGQEWLCHIVPDLERSRMVPFTGNEMKEWINKYEKKVDTPTGK